jgi:ribosomal protein L35
MTLAMMLDPERRWPPAPPEVSFYVRVSKRCDLVDDPRVPPIIQRLEKVLPRLTRRDKDLFFRAAESIAEAEQAKAHWNPKTGRSQHRRLSKSAIAAARLAEEIGAMMPPPWTGERAPISDLVQGALAPWADTNS